MTDLNPSQKKALRELKNAIRQHQLQPGWQILYFDVSPMEDVVDVEGKLLVKQSNKLLVKVGVGTKTPGVSLSGRTAKTSQFFIGPRGAITCYDDDYNVHKGTIGVTKCGRFRPFYK